jgi:hypothetical protein
MFIIETETTGPVVRVWVGGVAAYSAEVDVPSWDLEAAALSEAREHLGTTALADIVFHLAADAYEVIFEAGDLA